MTPFQARLQELRNTAGISKNDLGIAIGYSGTAVHQWENGKCVPSLEAAAVGAEYFGVSLDWLAGFTNEKTPPV